MFTLAHLSDPHLSPLPPVSLRQLINKRATGFLNWHRRRKQIHDMTTLGRIVADLKAARPDHIAATGDFVNIALSGEFEHARRWLEALGSPQDVTAIPGNHDVYVAGAIEAMQAAVGPFMQGDDGQAGFPFLRRRGPLALIGVNTGIPTPPFDATGLVGEPQLHALGAMLEAAKAQGAFRVVLIHHPPVSTRSADKRLRDSTALLAVIAAHGAELILHGHDHIDALVWLDGPQRRVPAVGVPSASAKPGASKCDAGYNLYRIGGGPGAWICEMEARGIAPDGALVTLSKAPLAG
jgi:3',5'-cyclic AMP phosphodiesterase CpdA